jgi:hypothetical protein
MHSSNSHSDAGIQPAAAMTGVLGKSVIGYPTSFSFDGIQQTDNTLKTRTQQRTARDTFVLTVHVAFDI